MVRIASRVRGSRRGSCLVALLAPLASAQVNPPVPAPTGTVTPSIPRRSAGDPRRRRGARECPPGESPASGSPAPAESPPGRLAQPRRRRRPRRRSSSIPRGPGVEPGAHDRSRASTARPARSPRPRPIPTIATVTVDQTAAHALHHGRRRRHDHVTVGDEPRASRATFPCASPTTPARSPTRSRCASPAIRRRSTFLRDAVDPRRPRRRRRCAPARSIYVLTDAVDVHGAPADRRPHRRRRADADPRRRATSR